MALRNRPREEEFLYWAGGERHGWRVPPPGRGAAHSPPNRWRGRAHGGIRGVTLRQKAAVSGGSDGRRSSTTQIYEGTNQVQRMVIARSLLKAESPEGGVS
jgi:hypothetical protein